MIVSITGHRPDKINNLEWVKASIAKFFSEKTPEKVIVGMARGVDLIAGEIALDMGIPVVAAKPWLGHYFPDSAYKRVWENGEQVIVHDSQAYPGPWVYHKRNEWMVDHADEVLAVWDGTKGGTAACVAYAQKVGKKIWYIKP